MKREVYIQKLQNRLQFVLLLAVFLPTIIDAVFKTDQNTADFGRIVLKWGNVIAFLILDYVLIELCEKGITDFFAKIIGWAMLIPSCAFGVVFVLSAEYPTAFPPIPAVIFKSSMYLLDAFPFILLLLLLWSFGSTLKHKITK